MEARTPVGVEELWLIYEDRLGVKDTGLEEITQFVIMVGMGLDGKAKDGQLQISGGKSEGEPGVVANREGLVEFVDEGVKEGGVGGSGNGGVDNGEGDCTVGVDKNFKSNSKTRIGFPLDGGGQVGLADRDVVVFGVRGRRVPRGVESTCGTGKGGRTLR